ncbi:MULTISPECIES: hypothetical protein [unclassified Cupriavidus]|uniref:hypothetical protein n=1 Tax=unclassified Cupriavidus TaxID=2640874 RepID=UPI001F238798|nr:MULTISPECIES: hypothetical protein [unclassified Cupriavidus]
MDMNTKSVMAVALAVTLLGAGGWSMAADADQGDAGDKAQTQSQEKGHAMRMDHAMGGGMMGSCPMMGQLPPGNEKLLMQMHGEMMQAMGEIMRKYADKVQVPVQK